MNYHNISHDDQNNGDGLRVVLWLSGCAHGCYNCQNSQTWNPSSGILFDKNAESEIFKQLDKDYISGITLSGGDPLHENNLSGVISLVNKIRHLYGDTKTIWLYSGYYWEEIFEPSFTEQTEDWIKSYLQTCEIRKKIISQCDVMIDGRFVEEVKDLSLKWCGSSNQSVINVQESLAQNRIVLYCESR